MVFFFFLELCVVGLEPLHFPSMFIRRFAAAVYVFYDDLPLVSILLSSRPGSARSSSPIYSPSSRLPLPLHVLGLPRLFLPSTSPARSYPFLPFLFSTLLEVLLFLRLSSSWELSARISYSLYFEHSLTLLQNTLGDVMFSFTRGTSLSCALGRGRLSVSPGFHSIPSELIRRFQS